MSVTERTATAREALLEWLTQNPKASKSQAAHWINNRRVGGEKLTLPFSEINRLFLQVRLKQQQPAFNPPRLVTVKPAPPPTPPVPPKPVPMEVPVPGTTAKETAFFTPGSADRRKYAEDLALEHPRWPAERIRAEVKKRFGVGVDSNFIQEALGASRTLAGMQAKFRNPKPASPPPATPEEKPAMPPLPEPPPPPLKPDAMLREAAGVLKHLVDRMGWEKLVISVDHKGDITYDATPLPVLAAKGSLRL